ncbi:uncharacterized protein LOC116288704 isoform X2 [Actinia tenebrosa]|uniref:Uncharacterized protein LOC116288704 isoform X2 n=1 Tax=Actinia tenebrosa TaxID=6105 RepID=A0A6P8HFM2_ACTTE|nr:uncharacterized protein LOC116288704 isoform X2 [Actinia tenebrosa]
MALISASLPPNASCKDAVELASMHCMAACDPQSLFTYGPRQGLKSFRNELADFLHDHYQDNVSSEHLMVTGGATQALIMLCSVFFEKGDAVFAEEPISPKELDIMKLLGLNIIPVPVDEDGLDVNELEKLLSSNSSKEDRSVSKRVFSGGLFLTPHFQNPTGACLSVERCKQLARLVAQHNILCISNDVYHCFSYGDGKAPFGAPPKRLFSYDTSHGIAEATGHIVSLGTFSTIFSPGMRMGWIEAFPNILDAVKNSVFVKHCGPPQLYLTGVMESVLGLGSLKECLALLRHTYNSRLECLCEALIQYLPNCTFIRPKGGFFIWLVLPSDMDAQVLLKVCKEKFQVDFQPGCSFSTDSTKLKTYLRLSITRYGDHTLTNAVSRIGEALKELTALR